ncbi:serine hydrolase [Bernardetia sp.]|uniref:serine hydrolase n=1 Tax=Bernardetia sp. TaxID=1937974 RepID=UPI0025BEF355|nr:serine hydrolase [Bernardetia sp.]
MRSISTKSYFIFLLLSILHFSSFAQTTVFEGTLIDKETKEVLPFCNIYFQNTQLGTVSNSEGRFRLLVPKEQEKDTLFISYMGYSTKKIYLPHLFSQEGNLIIELERDETKLDAVVVQSYTADFLVEKAIENISKNYYSDPIKTRGFYRVVSKKDRQYVHLSEAVFDLHLSKTEKPDRQFRLEKMRAIKDEKLSKGIDLGLKPNGIYEFDIVNSIKDTDLLNKKGLKLHDFELEGTEMIDGKEVFKISFDQKEEKKAGYKGYLLIDKEDFAFLYFEFGLSPKGIAYHKYGDAATRTLMKLLDVNISVKDETYQIFYKKIGNTYYLNNLSSSILLNFQSNRQHFNFDLDTKLNYLTTSIDTTTKEPFTQEEVLGKGRLIEHQNSVYDKDFWENYTIVLPNQEDDFTEIAKTIAANNKANDLKKKVSERLYKLPKDKALRVDSLLTFYNNEGLFNGNALITYEDEIILDKSYNNPLTQNTKNSQFRLGSLSKTFTAVLILQLEKEGKISFQDSVGTFLSNYRHPQITISQLLSHQSGIPDYLKKNAYVTQIMEKPYSSQKLVELFCSDSLEFEPSQKFEYSNSNYVLLARIIEKITNQDFSKVIQEKIFAPLEMNDTFFGSKEEPNNIVKGFMYGKPEPSYFIENVIGAGGITSTTKDVLKWSKVLDGKYPQFIEITDLEKLFTPQAEYTDWDAFYGYGFMIDSHYFKSSKDSRILYHPGTDFGFYTMFLKQPTSGITIILLNNTGDFPRFEISDIILEQFDN